MKNIFKNISFRRRMALSFIALMVVTVFSLGAVQNYFLGKAIHAEEEARLSSAEREIAAAMQNIDQLDYLAESHVSPQLEKITRQIDRDLLANGGNAQKLALTEYVAATPGVDAFLINRACKVIASTDPVDLGLDFKKASPEFAESLRGFFKQKNFAMDRLSFRTLVPDVKIYSYQTSSDGKFIIELGIGLDVVLSDNPRMQEILEAQNLEGTIKRIAGSDPAIVSLNIYSQDGRGFFRDKNGKLTSVKTEHISYLQKAVRESRIIRMGKNESNLIYSYIPYNLPSRHRITM